MPPAAPRITTSPSDATTAIPVQRRGGPSDDEPATRAIPVSKPRGDSDTATEKLNAHDDSGEKPQRRGGGVSAQDLLRREGRL
jgi:RND superfamily putative drug exporter